MFTNDDLDIVFHALAHKARRTMLDHISGAPGISVGELASKFDVSRIAVMNHLAVLEKADLIISKRDGRSRKLFMNVMPIKDIHDRWTDQYSAHWAERVNTIKFAAEAAAKNLNRNNSDE